MSTLIQASIIIVNYNGRHLLEECLDSVLNQSVPKKNYEVIVVDNNSSDDSVFFLEKKYGNKITLVQSETNSGFTGGNILGYEHSQGKNIVLLNNDVHVDRRWLENLLLAAKPNNVGMVNGKLFTHSEYYKLEIESSLITKSDITPNIDFTPLGNILEEPTYQSGDQVPGIFYADGFQVEMKKSHLSSFLLSRKNTMFVSKDSLNSGIVFRFHCHNTTKKKPYIKLSSQDNILLEKKFTENKVIEYKLTLNKLSSTKSIHLIQNAGNELLRVGDSKDIGTVSILRPDGKMYEFYDEDSDYYSAPRTLTAACGAAVLIKRSTIEKAGFLDDIFFMYYEDVELSTRVRKLGLKCVFEPKAVGYHIHKASTNSQANLFLLKHIARNRLFFQFMHWPLKTVINNLVRYITVFFKHMLQFFLYQFISIERRQFYKTATLLNIEVLSEVFKAMPYLLTKRMEWHRKQKVSIKKLLSYEH